MSKALTNNTTMKRIHREIKDLEKEDMGGMTLTPSEDNIFSWKATIPGPEGSPYEGGVFTLSVDLSADYPFSAPKVMFLTRIYHMNISERGSVCIDILKSNWSPALSLYKVLLSLSSLLTDPNPKDPLVPSIATEYQRNRKKHDSTARHWTQLYALPPKQPYADASKSASSSKGKAKADPLQMPTPSTSGFSTPTEPLAMAIPVATAMAMRRTERTVGRPRVPASRAEVIVLDTEPEPSQVGAVARPRSHAAVKRKREHVEDVVGESAGAGELPARRRRAEINGTGGARLMGDIIVIDD